MSYARSERGGFLARALRTLQPRAVLAWALVLVVVFSITSGVVDAIPNLEMTFMGEVAILGATLGWLLAQLSMKAWFAALLSFIFGVELLLVRVGSLASSMPAIIAAAWRATGESVLWYWTKEAPEWGTVWTLSLELWGGMGTMLRRTFGWLSTIGAGSGTFDVVGATLVWGLIAWIYSVWAGWVTRRHYRAVLGVLPGSILLGFSISYTGSNPYIFLPVLGASLLLMALMQQASREERWIQSGIDFSQGLWSDIALLATGLSIAVVLVSAVAPSITIERITKWVREITERSQPAQSSDGAVAEGLGFEPKPEPREFLPIESLMSTGLPQRHLIGSGPELRRQIVMLVETGELPPISEEMLVDEAPRHYWRSITYDRYFSRGWSTSNTEMVEYEAGELLTELDAPYLRTLRQTVRLVGDRTTDIVHVDGVLVSVDQDFVVSLRPPGEMFAATTEARQYRADSLYPLVTVEQLREASQVYPDWILSRYLQLPDTVPTRVKELALELTATELTPYDRALAIETYLRENYTYNLDVTTPGVDNDIADYFLFQIKEGYCDYFATSMVVLARAAGLPSRLVIGYASGQYDPLAARYIVTEADAHAWPEVYFPDYGWIEFEPTAGLPGIFRSMEPERPIWPEGGPQTPLVEPRRQILPELVVGLWLAAGLVGVLGIVGLTTGLDSLSLYLSRPERLVRRLQLRLRRQARRLRVPLRRGDTPNEIAGLLGQRIKTIAASHGFTGVEFVEPAADEVQELADLYVHTWYSPVATLSRQQRWHAAWLWWRLRWRFALARLWRRAGTRRPTADESETGQVPEKQQRHKEVGQGRLRFPPG